MSEAIIKQIQAALEVEPRINLHRFPIKVHEEGGKAVLEGETEHIAALRKALQIARSIAGDIIDRLSVHPSEAMRDDELREHLCADLLAEREFLDCRIEALDKGQWAPVRALPEAPCGHLKVRVEDGIVHLDGQVTSLSHRSLAAALAWWIPGTRRVFNCLQVSPPEEANDDELKDVVFWLIERDPLVNRDNILVRCKERVVTLEGWVPREKEKWLAEWDAWYVEEVRDVDNRLTYEAV